MFMSLKMGALALNNGKDVESVHLHSPTVPESMHKKLLFTAGSKSRSDFRARISLGDYLGLVLAASLSHLQSITVQCDPIYN